MQWGSIKAHLRGKPYTETETHQMKSLANPELGKRPYRGDVVSPIADKWKVKQWVGIEIANVRVRKTDYKNLGVIFLGIDERK